MGEFSLRNHIEESKEVTATCRRQVTGKPKKVSGKSLTNLESPVSNWLWTGLGLA
jgi:hypothetical protein